MKLEEIVPPMELCKKIPKGEFANSAMVWASRYRLCGRKPEIVPREYVAEVREIAPAPTLEEILEAIDATGCSFSLTECDDRYRTRDALEAWGNFTDWGKML